MAMMGPGAQGAGVMSQRPIGTYRSAQQGRCSTPSSRVDLEIKHVAFECRSSKAELWFPSRGVGKAAASRQL